MLRYSEVYDEFTRENAEQDQEISKLMHLRAWVQLMGSVLGSAASCAVLLMVVYGMFEGWGTAWSTVALIGLYVMVSWWIEPRLVRRTEDLYAERGRRLQKKLLEAEAKSFPPEPSEQETQTSPQ